MEEWIPDPLNEAKLPGEVVGRIELEALLFLRKAQVATRDRPHETGFDIRPRLKEREEAICQDFRLAPVNHHVYGRWWL